MNEIEINLNQNPNFKNEIKSFLESMRNSCNASSIVQITMLDEKFISADAVKSQFEGLISMWFVDKNISLEAELVQILKPNKEMPISLIITINNLHYFMINGSVAKGFIGSKELATKATDIALSLHRLCR